MSARRPRAAGASYPNLLPGDVVGGGQVCLYRNDRNRRFGEQDQHTITGTWALPADVPFAYGQVAAEEQKLAATHAFAWHPEFGYLSPWPDHCGTGLSIWAEFHLEGLHLIGDLPPALNGLEAVRVSAQGVDADGMHNVAHLFRVWNGAALGLSEQDLVKRVTRVFGDLVQQELAARRMLVEEHPRVFEDAVVRAVAILRAARLLSPWELLDLLSPLRLAATMGFLDGLTREEALKLMKDQTATPDPPPETIEEERARDARDAARADEANARFARVALNARARRILGG